MVNDSESTAPAGTTAGTTATGYAPEHEAPATIDTPAVLATSILTPADQLAAKLAKSRYEWRSAALALAVLISQLYGFPPEVDRKLFADACEKARTEGEAQGDDRSMQATLQDALALDAEIEQLQAAQPAPAEAQQAA